MGGLLIVYGTKEGQTARVAEAIARVARRRGMETTVLDGKVPPESLQLADYCAIILAASVHAGRHERYIERFARAHSATLNALPSAFVSISLSASRPETRQRAEEAAATFLRRTGWTPTRQALVGGALLYRRYNPVLRWIMKRISAQQGRPIDSSHNYDYTDWPAVERFTEDFLTLLTAPATTPA